MTDLTLARALAEAHDRLTCISECLDSYEPCQGGDELHEHHLAYCVPFYEMRRSLLGGPKPQAEPTALDERFHHLGPGHLMPDPKAAVKEVEKWADRLADGYFKPCPKGCGSMHPSDVPCWGPSGGDV